MDEEVADKALRRKGSEGWGGSRQALHEEKDCGGIRLCTRRRAARAAKAGEGGKAKEAADKFLHEEDDCGGSIQTLRRQQIRLCTRRISRAGEARLRMQQTSFA